ncbi:acyl carrier protein [Streptomyces sp. MC1]|uniref:acyl carrier protein n=1 Tax=Streptomyces sp. MC1 TaxID=295105 RepID=UPI0018C9E721|nr:acyl carrier protein [Streptomyces sp. MC1]MBG7704684.1 acyl carrier protein [Streptomyces sp. MC1]
MGLPTVERTPEQTLAEARLRLGLAVEESEHSCRSSDIPPGEGRYVVADAFFLPWVPHHRRRHMDHSFVLLPGEGDEVWVRDSYLNETPWGSARPGLWLLNGAALADLETVSLSVNLAAAPPPPSSPVPLLDLASEDEADAYVTAYERHPHRPAALQQLALETWLLSRGRELHTAFLQQHTESGVTDRMLEHVAAWKALTEQVYLAYRRVDRGRAEPAEPLRRLRQLLGEDPRVFARTADEVAEAARPDDVPMRTAGPASERSHDDPRVAVACVAAETLGADPAALLAGASLSDLPGFSSFRIVEMVERLEERFDIEFRADDLVPENLHHVDDLTRAVARGVPASQHLTTARAESTR